MKKTTRKRTGKGPNPSVLGSGGAARAGQAKKTRQQRMQEALGTSRNARNPRKYPAKKK